MDTTILLPPPTATSPYKHSKHFGSLRSFSSFSSMLKKSRSVEVYSDVSSEEDLNSPPTAADFKISCAQCVSPNHTISQDQAFYHVFEEGSDTLCCLDAMVGVFDGHGGSACADFVARRLAIRIEESFTMQEHWENGEKLLKVLFDEVDKEFCTAAEKSSNFSGSCGTVCLVRKGEMLIANVGDCNAFYVPVEVKYRKGVELTSEHRASCSNEQKRIENAGGKVIGGRIYSLEPSRSFGDIDVKYKLQGEKKCLISEPYVKREKILTNIYNKQYRSFILVASDGIWDVLNISQISKVIKDGLKTNKTCDDLSKTILEKAKTKGSMDDITLVLVLL
eukprot:snap_masked-scaffold_9-processed-gene-1.24-mRNA-1 protein AED:1.00 eAED:1.00 QI:0/0/0/0/1/1/2/0/334